METEPAGGQPPILNIIGQKVALGPLRRELVPLYLRWINDFTVLRNLAIGVTPTTLESEEAWYERVSKSERDVVFTVYERATLRPIGDAGLHAIDHLNRTAEYGIFIGESDRRGKGYGGEVTALLLDYGFNLLGLHSIMLRVFGYNERALRVYERAGFRPAGRLREAHRLGGQAYDVILMDCLASEFRRPSPDRQP